MNQDVVPSQGAPSMPSLIGTLTNYHGRDMYFYLYKDTRGEWRWTLRSGNHEPISVSSEGYVSKQGALHGIALVKTGAPSAPTYDESTKSWS
jgi:uncharacterized protein